MYSVAQKVQTMGCKKSSAQGLDCNKYTTYPGYFGSMIP